VLDCTDRKCLFSNRGEITKEGLNVIFSLKGTNRIYNRRLLISLSLPKAAYVCRLNKIGLIRREFDYLDIIYLSFQNELVCLMTRSTVDQKNML
jgi:hypothetical protein